MNTLDGCSVEHLCRPQMICQTIDTHLSVCLPAELQKYDFKAYKTKDKNMEAFLFPIIVTISQTSKKDAYYFIKVNN